MQLNKRQLKKMKRLFLFFLLVMFFVNSFLLVAFMGSFFVPMQKPVRDIHKIYSICYESQLNYKFYVQELLSHHVRTYEVWPIFKLQRFQLLEEKLGSWSSGNRYKQCIQKHKKIYSSHDWYLLVRLLLIIFKKARKIN